MKLGRQAKILAIDPGTREMGIALLEDGGLIYHGVKTIPKLASPHDRLRLARRMILRLFRDFRPTLVVVEKTFFRNNRNAALLNVLFDEIRAIGRRRGLPVKSLGHSTVKNIVCGDGRASKEEVARVIVSRFPELKVYLAQDRKWKQRYHENMFDAVALGLAYLTMLLGTEEATCTNSTPLVRRRRAARSTS